MKSQVHRELTSALSMPTGFKNSTDGSVGIAVDACGAARTPHVFLSVGKEGLSSIIETGKREKATSGWILNQRRQSVVRQGGLSNG
jgi:phospho-2-dehydro-3-deoxyheptonate aldolase